VSFLRRVFRAAKLVARDPRIPRPLKWLAALGLLPVPFDEAVLRALVLGGTGQVGVAVNRLLACGWDVDHGLVKNPLPVDDSFGYAAEDSYLAAIGRPTTSASRRSGSTDA
jgi:hypothetical protein